MSAAFTIFAKKVGRERRIPFEVAATDAADTANPFYSEANIRYWEKKMKDFKARCLHFSEHALIEA